MPGIVSSRLDLKDWKSLESLPKNSRLDHQTSRLDGWSSCLDWWSSRLDVVSGSFCLTQSPGPLIQATGSRQLCAVMGSYWCLFMMTLNYYSIRIKQISCSINICRKLNCSKKFKRVKLKCYHLILGFVVSWKLFAWTLSNLCGEGANLVLKTAIHWCLKALILLYIPLKFLTLFLS